MFSGGKMAANLDFADDPIAALLSGQPRVLSPVEFEQRKRPTLLRAEW
jgi:hypothetical protein